MYTAIAILIVIASIFLTIIVLVQNSKGGGLAANFAAGNQTFGVRQTADFLEKSTWALALIIIVLCVLSSGMSYSQNQYPAFGDVQLINFSSLDMNVSSTSNPFWQHGVHFSDNEVDKIQELRKGFG